MADYLLFAGRIPISDFESSDSEQELNIIDLALEEEPEVQFNNPDVVAESLAMAPVPTPKVSRKRPLDIAPDEEELIEDSDLFMKRPHIPGCPDMKKWLMKNRSPTSFQDLDIQNHCAESLRFPSDVFRWAKYGKDDIPNAILGHILEV